MLEDFRMKQSFRIFLEVYGKEWRVDNEWDLIPPYQKEGEKARSEESIYEYIEQ